MTQDTIYFSNGKYDIYKSEKRRQEIKRMVMGTRRIPKDISMDEYNRQKDIQNENIAHRMMFKIFNQSKG